MDPQNSLLGAMPNIEVSVSVTRIFHDIETLQESVEIAGYGMEYRQLQSGYLDA